MDAPLQAGFPLVRSLSIVIACCTCCSAARRSKRQRLFTVHAAVLLCLQTAYSVCYVSALSLELAQPDCSYAWTALSALEFVRVGGSLQGWALHAPP